MQNFSNMQPIVVTFLTQACASIRVGDIDIVSDPWFSGPTHLGSWRSYPELTSDQLTDVHSRIDGATHIYISHDHADHFDPFFLQSLSRKTILVGEFRNARFNSALYDLGVKHDVRFVRSGEVVDLYPGVGAQIFTEHPPFRTNSMFLLSTENGAILNANDCGLNSGQLGQIARKYRVRLFMSTLNYLANGYPYPYLRRDDPALNFKVAEVRSAVMKSFESALRILKPDIAAAFGGPVTFVDSINAHLNSCQSAIDWSDMINALAKSTRVLWPSFLSSIELSVDSVICHEQESWSAVLAARPPSPTIAGRLSEALHVSEHELRGAAQRCLDRLMPALVASAQRITVPLWLSTTSCLEEMEHGPFLHHLCLNFDHEGGRCSLTHSMEMEPPYLRIIATSSIVRSFLEGETTLDDLLLSSCARFVREPDVFNATLHNFLRFGHDAASLQALVDWYRRQSRVGETMEIVVDGVVRRIPRVCPHEGESLAHATIEDGKLICPRHKWAFDLATGYCIAGGDPGINLYTIAAEADR